MFCKKMNYIIEKHISRDSRYLRKQNNPKYEKKIAKQYYESFPHSHIQNIPSRLSELVKNNNSEGIFRSESLQVSYFF